MSYLTFRSLVYTTRTIELYGIRVLPFTLSLSLSPAITLVVTLYLNLSKYRVHTCELFYIVVLVVIVLVVLLATTLATIQPLSCCFDPPNQANIHLSTALSLSLSYFESLCSTTLMCASDDHCCYTTPAFIGLCA